MQRVYASSACLVTAARSCSASRQLASPRARTSAARCIAKLSGHGSRVTCALIGQYPGHVTISRPLIGDLLPPPPGDEVHVEAEQEGDGNPRTLLPVDKIIPCSVDIIDRFLTILSKTIFKDIKLPFLRFLKLPAPQYEFFKLLLLFQGTTIPAKMLMIYNI